MHALYAVDDIGAQAEEVVNYTPDRHFVARDRRGRNHHRVAWFDLHVLVIAIGHTRHRGHWLTLTAGANDRHLIVGQIVGLVWADQRARLGAQIAQIQRDP